jgi:hypothetical protein
MSDIHHQHGTIVLTFPMSTSVIITALGGVRKEYTGSRLSEFSALFQRLLHSSKSWIVSFSVGFGSVEGKAIIFGLILAND